MKKSVTTSFLIALSAAVLRAGNHGGSGSTASVSGGTNTFIETYDDGTDVGLWPCSVNVPRILETNGGNPGAHIQQGGFISHVPTWSSVSPRLQPGANDTYKIDSIYTGDSTTLCPTRLIVELNI